jgi:glycosyltransferase involved in cell wall biosynthesis
MLSPQPFFRARGTPFSVLHRVRGLVAAGHSVHLLTYPFGRDVPLSELEVTRCKRPPFVRDVRVGPSVAKLALDVSLYSLARRSLRSGIYDIVHSHEEAAFFGVGLARRHGLRHVYDMHSSLPQQLRNFRSYDWLPFRKLFSTLEEYVLRNSDGVITVCPDLGSMVDGMGLHAPHSMIENTADDTKVFGSDIEDVRARWSLKNKKIVLYTGTLEAYQGIDLLIAAMPDLCRRFPDVHALIVGGRPSQIEHYRRMAVGLAVDGAVTFVGTQPPSDMPAFAKAADVIVSPRCRGTNTPGKLYGYMRTGRPIVATDHVSHTQVLDSAIAELVPVTSRGLLGGLARILSDPDHARKMAETARQRAEQEYSDEIYLSRVANFYSVVANQSRRNNRLANSAR